MLPASPSNAQLLMKLSGPVLSDGLAGLLVVEKKSFALTSTLGSPMLA